MTILAAAAITILTASPAQPVEMLVTAYCPCAACCGQYSPEVGGHGLTASGARPVRGLTLAADRSVPLGTVLCVEGHGVRVVQDRGGAIKGSRLDLYLPTHQEALEHGIQRLKVWVVGSADEVLACEGGAL